MSEATHIIRSRPEEVVTIGVDGDYQLLINEHELELIAALLCHCRLGSKTNYSKAASTLLAKIEQVMGVDDMQEACDVVDLQATIEDSAGNVVLVTGDDYFVTLEV